MSIFRRIAPALAATVTLPVLALMPSPASAAPATFDGSPSARPSTCTSLSVCGYGNENYSTSEGYQWIPTRAAGRCEYIGAALNDRWSSVYNSSGRAVRLYHHADCTGSYLTLSNGFGYNNLTLYQSGHNDRFSAVKFL